MASILVTTGATVTFKPLIEYVLSSQFIQGIIDLRVATLTVQYGNEIRGDSHISTDYFEGCLSNNGILRQFELSLQSEHDGVKKYTSEKYPFQLVSFPYSRDISHHINNCDMVVSHAGTGSIIDTLKLHKPLVIVSNSDLMDNHQEEIASEFATLNYCLKLRSDDLQTSKLLDCINQVICKEVKFDILKELEVSPIGNIIYSEVE